MKVNGMDSIKLMARGRGLGVEWQALNAWALPRFVSNN